MHVRSRWVSQNTPHRAKPITDVVMCSSLEGARSRYRKIATAMTRR